MNRRLAALAVVGALAALLATVALAATPRPTGSLKQVGGKDGCYTADGDSTAGGANSCRDARAVGGATSTAIAPDGKFAYVSGYGASTPPPGVPPGLAVFRRNTDDGTLRQLSGKQGCFSRTGRSEDGPNTCKNARNLDTGDATSLTISRDGRFLYVASQLRTGMTSEPGGIAIFRRNRDDGTLRQLAGKDGCVSATGESEDGPNTCAKARAVDEISNVHITPDQKYLYASNYESPPYSGIAIFKRGSKNGKLRQLRGKNGCITTDGTTLQSGTNAVCRANGNLDVPWDVATPDNKFAYIPAKTPADLVQAFKRNSAGGLVPLQGRHGCVSDDGTSPEGPCVDGRGLHDVERAVLSKNERFIYTNGYSIPSPIAVLNRNRNTGELSQRRGAQACLSRDGTSGGGETCRDGRAIAGGYAGTLASNGRTLYFAEYSANGMVVLRTDRSSGDFHQLPGKLGCVTGDGSSEEGAGTCARGRAVEGAYQALTRGRHVYLSAYGGNGVALFHSAR